MASPETAHASWRIDLGLFLLRLLPGIVFVFHGSQKLFSLFGGKGLGAMAGFLEQKGVPAPMLAATLAGLAEFLGGLALLTGFATRILSIPLIFNMAVACLLVHRSAFDAGKGGMEYPLTLGFVVLGIAILGPGRWTVPNALRPSRSEIRSAPDQNAALTPPR